MADNWISFGCHFADEITGKKIFMKTGKITENVLKRSVLKQIKNRREEVLTGAGTGEDCAVLSFGDEEVSVVSTDSVCGDWSEAAAQAVFTASNNVAAAGGEPFSVMVSLLLPEDSEEQQLKTMMREMDEVCSGLGIQISGGHTAVQKGVNCPVITVTCIGKAKRGETFSAAGAKPEQDVVVTKWVGMEGTAILAEKKEKELLSRYPAYLVDEAKSFGRQLSVIPEAATAGKSGISAMHDAAEGGIFGALWEIGQSSGVGLEIDLKKLPIRQETVEVCNHLDVNPYELKSGGSLVIVTEKGSDLVRILEAEGIPAVVVGKTTAGNDRVILNEEERRFLEPMRQDQLNRI